MSEGYWAGSYWGDSYWASGYWSQGGTIVPISLVGAWMTKPAPPRRRVLSRRILLLLKEYLELKLDVKPSP